MKPVKILSGIVLGFENGKYTIEVELEYDGFTRTFWGGTVNKEEIDNALKLEDKKKAKAIYFLIKEEITPKIIDWQLVLDNQN